MAESTLKVNLVYLDPREDPIDNSLTPIGELKKVQIGTEDFQITRIVSGLSQEEETKIINMLKDNVDHFAWKPSYMAENIPKVVGHQLSLDLSLQVVAQRKRKNGKEKGKAVTEEVVKLMKGGFIKEIRYPT